MNIDNLKNNLNERENLSADEQKISNLVGGLEKVSAPKDFDFRLKARISAAKENNFQPTIWQSLRYVLPLTATVVIAAFVMIQAGMFSGDTTLQENNFASANQVQQQIVNNSFAPSNREIVQTSNSNEVENSNKTFTGNTLIAETNSEKIPKAKNSEKKSSSNLSKPKKDNFKGFIDKALEPSKVNLPPAGIPKKITRENNDSEQKKSVSAREVFDLIGIETESDGNKLKVKGVKKNSVADLSGVKTGDVIEAVGEQKLEQNNPAQKLEGANTITVTRDNKVQKIELKP